MIDTIVLDLDGTLISTVNKPIKSKQLTPHIFEDLFVYKRPHVDLFIRHILNKYKHIYVWSDSHPSYIKFILLILFGGKINRVERIFTRADCDTSEKMYGIKKDLKYIKTKTGRLIKNMVILEDSPINVKPTHNRVFINRVDFDDKNLSISAFLKDNTLKKLIHLKYI